MFEQQQIMEDVKKLLQELNNFFSVTLKKERLKKETVTEKDRLFGKLKETLVKLVGEESQGEYDDVSMHQEGGIEGDDSGLLYEDTAEPQRLMVDGISHTGSQKSSEYEDEGDEDKGDINYEETRIRPKSVSELGQTSKEGILDKKRKEGQFGFSAWQTRFCIIKDNMLYYYKSRTDSKQCNEIDLSGYEATSAPEIEKKHKRKHLLILVSMPGSRSFQFIAPDEEEMHSWIDAINYASTLTPPPPETVPVSGGDSVSMANSENNDFDGEYEDLSDYQKPHPTPEPTSDFGETYDDVSVAQMNAGGHMSVRDTPLPPPPEQGDILPPLPPVQPNTVPPPTIQAAPLPHPPEDAPKPTSRGLPDLPPRVTLPRNLPPVPAPGTVTSNGTNGAEPWVSDLKNIYMGKWDCSADEENELDFQRGDMIHILSQEYGGWWIGEKHYRVGLVPRGYLMKAYI